jgi:CRISPR-associated protein Csb2
MGRYQQFQHRRKYGKSQKPYQEQFRSEVLSGKDATGHYLAGHDHAYYLPTPEGDDCRRLTHVTVYAGRGFDVAETAALTGLQRLRVGELELRTQLVGLGKPSDFRADLFGGGAGGATIWTSLTPFVGPAHVGRAERERYLRKAIRREVRRRASLWPAGVEVEAVDAVADTDPAWAGRPRPFEFHRSRSRAGDDGYRRPFGTFRLTFSAPINGPLCLGYACHFGLGLFLPAQRIECAPQ